MEVEQPYRVERDDDRDTFVVFTDTGRKVLTCRDENSAGHYVVLLSEAYRRGYRDGKRA